MGSYQLVHILSKRNHGRTNHCQATDLVSLLDAANVNILTTTCRVMLHACLNSSMSSAVTCLGVPLTSAPTVLHCISFTWTRTIIILQCWLYMYTDHIADQSPCQDTMQSQKNVTLHLIKLCTTVRHSLNTARPPHSNDQQRMTEFYMCEILPVMSYELQ